MATMVQGCPHAVGVSVFQHTVVCPIDQVDAVAQVVRDAGFVPTGWHFMRQEQVDSPSFDHMPVPAHWVRRQFADVDRFAQDWAE